MEAVSTLTKSQRKTFSREYMEEGEKKKIYATVRYDDECGNGHNSFSITGDVYRADKRGNYHEGDKWHETGGCIHNEIARRLPKLAKYLKWHLFDSTGPMHYIANTLYHAGDRDHNGKRAGEPSGWDYAVRFGDFPIVFKIKGKFSEFLQNCHPDYDLEVIQIDYDGAGKYEFEPKHTFGGFADHWHNCPFDTEPEAMQFLEALQTFKPKFLRVPTSWSKGKARELDAARSTAVWPDATDEELSQDKEALRASLLARLPGLLKDFRADVEELGFTY